MTQTGPLPQTHLRWLAPQDMPAWDRFVHREPAGLIYQSSEWKCILESAFPQMKGEFLAAWNNDEIIGGIPLYLVQSWLMGKRLISVPFASVLELMMSPEQLAQALPMIVERHQQICTRPVELRCLRSANFPANSGFTISSDHKHHYLPLGKTESETQRSFSSNIKRLISKATKAGLTVRKAQGEEDVASFYQLFSSTRRRLSLPPVPSHFFRNLFQISNPNHFSLFLAFAKEAPMGGVWISKFKKIASLEFTGEAPEGRNSGVSQLLYWNAIAEAIRDGREIYSFGRTANDNEGLLDHKRRWGTVEEDLFQATYGGADQPEVQNPQQSFSYNFARKLAGKLPMPLFHLMGKFCFRHWA